MADAAFHPMSRRLFEPMANPALHQCLILSRLTIIITQPKLYPLLYVIWWMEALAHEDSGTGKPLDEG